MDYKQRVEMLLNKLLDDDFDLSKIVTIDPAYCDCDHCRAGTHLPLTSNHLKQTLEAVINGEVTVTNGLQEAALIVFYNNEHGYGSYTTSEHFTAGSDYMIVAPNDEENTEEIEDSHEITELSHYSNGSDDNGEQNRKVEALLTGALIPLNYTDDTYIIYQNSAGETGSIQLYGYSEVEEPIIIFNR